MVDVYHLFKLGVSAAKVLKASNGARNAIVIFKQLRRPLAMMGAMGMLDAATEEVTDRVIKEISDGSSRR